MHLTVKYAALIATSGLVLGSIVASTPSSAASTSLDKTVTLHVTDGAMQGKNVCGPAFGYGSATPQYAAYARQDKPGDQYIGWTTAQNTSAFGPRLNVLNEPVDDLASFGFDAKSSVGISGVLRVFVNDSNRAGYWVGTKEFTNSSTGWVRIGLNGTVFTNWKHYKAGTTTVTNMPDGQSTFSGSTKQLVAKYGGKLAEINPLVGCSGGTTYVDNLRLSDGEDVITWDLEGYLPTMKWSAWTGANTDTWTANLSRNSAGHAVYTKKSPVYREYVWASASNEQGDRMKAPVTFQALVGGAWATLKVINPTNGLARLNDVYDDRRLPNVKTYYRFCTPGAGVVDGGCSHPLVLQVPFAVGTTAPRAVVKDKRIQVGVNVTPKEGQKAAGVRATLQRYVKGRWQTVASRSTYSTGTTTLAIRKAASTGRWTLRVVVAGSARNVGKVSRTFVVVVKPKPRKRSAQPAAGSTFTNTNSGGQDTKPDPKPGF